MTWLKDKGTKIPKYILDNEASEDYSQAIKRNGIENEKSHQTYIEEMWQKKQSEGSRTIFKQWWQV